VQQPGDVQLAEPHGQPGGLEGACKVVGLATPGIRHERAAAGCRREPRDQRHERGGELTVVEDVRREHEIERPCLDELVGKVPQVCDQALHPSAGSLAIALGDAHGVGVMVDGEDLGSAKGSGHGRQREAAAELDRPHPTQLVLGEICGEGACGGPQLGPVRRIERARRDRVVEQPLGLAGAVDAHTKPAAEIDLLVDQLDPRARHRASLFALLTTGSHTSHVATKGIAAQDGTLDGLTLAATDLVERGIAWLATYGATDVTAEMRHRFNGGGPAGVALCLRATIASSPKDPTPPVAMILVELDDRDVPTSALSELTLHGRRKQLRHVARRATKAVKTVQNLSLAQAPEGEKKDPATLTVTTALDPSEPIEELVSHSLRLLDTLVVELAARRE
jgi:hypothetical protein